MAPKLCIVVLLLTGCVTRPKTNTPAPVLGTAREMTNGIRTSIGDSKDSIHRSKTLAQQIEDKVIMLRDYK